MGFKGSTTPADRLTQTFGHTPLEAAEPRRDRSNRRLAAGAFRPRPSSPRRAGGGRMAARARWPETHGEMSSRLVRVVAFLTIIMARNPRLKVPPGPASRSRATTRRVPSRGPGRSSSPGSSLRTSWPSSGARDAREAEWPEAIAAIRLPAVTGCRFENRSARRAARPSRAGAHRDAARYDPMRLCPHCLPRTTIRGPVAQAPQRLRPAKIAGKTYSGGPGASPLTFTAFETARPQCDDMDVSVRGRGPGSGSGLKLQG